jgi:phosphoadenosine phosphosulfate reductase
MTATLSDKIKTTVTRIQEVVETHHPAAFSTSLSAEDMVLLDLIKRTDSPVTVFTLDTGRLPRQTYDLLDAVQKRYDGGVRVFTPCHTELEQLVSEQGVNAFYRSVESRKACCDVRKVRPLRRALDGNKLWLTGLRWAQSAATRSQLDWLTWDDSYQLYKFNPMLDWTTDEVFGYVKEFSILNNALYEEGYTSIGCDPCTRAIKEGEDERAGRWWWESPDSKECGLHIDHQGRLVRSTT